jgi:hypothetical protein
LILFFPAGNTIQFEVFDTITNNWSTGYFNEGIQPDPIISVNNIIYIGGGYVNDVLSNQVWKLEF